MDNGWDILIIGAIVMDGTGVAPSLGDIAIKDGYIAARGPGLDRANAARIIDASGTWLMPGLLDIHTHYDLEVELSPGLPESVRHGTTTVVVSNCSLGLAFGAQRQDGKDPIVDCFARVENIPKHVLKAVADKVTWNTSDAYLEHLDGLNLGPNIVPMIPYSMLRIEAMGLDASVTRDPDKSELEKMDQLLEKGMAEGYVGFSTDSLPFHYLANDPNADKRIPAQYGGFQEIKRLMNIVRKHDRVWQATPPTESPLNILRYFMLSSARLYKKALKITAVAALDVRANRNTQKKAYFISRLINSSILRGKFKLQALAAPFKVWSDGPVSPLSEEIPELRALMMLDLEDREGRMALLNDPVFCRQFCAMWMKGKRGFGLSRLKRILSLEDFAMRRAIDEMIIEDIPVNFWIGQNLGEVFARLLKVQAGKNHAALSEDEATYFANLPIMRHEADFMLHLLREYDRDFIWSTVSANDDEQRMRKALLSDLFLPGFADSGAHLTNMAFYDVNLRALRIAWEDCGEVGVAKMVRRLTREPSEFFGISSGTLDIGAQADMVLMDPERLKSHDGEATVDRVYRDILQTEQLVTRSEGVVPLVMIRGEPVWQDGTFTDVFEQRPLGRVLLAKGGAPDTAISSGIATE